MYSKFFTPNVKYLYKWRDNIGNENTNVRGHLATTIDTSSDRVNI